MDKETRNLLAKVTQDCRIFLEEDFSEQLEGTFDIFQNGRISENSSAPLNESQKFIRHKIIDAISIRRSKGESNSESVDAFLRECAFTFTNRIAALKMMEARGIAHQCVSKGEDSSGFKEFGGLASGLVALPDRGYRLYLESLFDEIGVEVGILFDRSDPNSLLWPRRKALVSLLETINDPRLAKSWAQDETIGWIYQYYNTDEDRRAARYDSKGKPKAPQNSRELAVRNQFFTPRYVVEFLTDNTLGRIWYEMTKGRTRLKDQCRYLIRRPTEIFLAEVENTPETSTHEGLSQEELLKQPAYIPHRPIKDPREIRLIDPACGSMHFGLYAFDLFETIYEEAWDIGSCPSLQEAYASKSEFLRDIPRLIIEHNIHGIDIDPRATQIAGLSLWLRAQKAWQQQEVSAADRPRVRRSNIVCAEPMPGSSEMLEKFVATLDPPLLGELVKTVFEKMQLAGEAGSLLKIEEEILAAIDTAKKAWEKLGASDRDLFSIEELNKTLRSGAQQELTGFEKSLVKDTRPLHTDFFTTAEQNVINALRTYAEQADADSYQRRLFADDAARGFAFIDICSKRYDSWVMNPPFGDVTTRYQNIYAMNYPLSKADMACGFGECAMSRMAPGGRIGVLMTRTPFFLSSFSKWRIERIIKQGGLQAFADLGYGVLDAMVETCAFVLQPTLRVSPVTAPERNSSHTAQREKKP